uniref:Chromo domain-containing protein n=1 Tax=Micrurus spixii TaxID=129469 RepID=A0A2D4LQY5_9SAUR
MFNIPSVTPPKHHVERIQWSEECNIAFETLKKLFSQSPILKHPDQKIDKILGCRRNKSGTQYLVRWKGFPDIEATWVNTQDIQADRLIANYHNMHRENK